MMRISSDGYITSDIFPNSVRSGFGTTKSKDLHKLFPDNELIKMQQFHSNKIHIFSDSKLDSPPKCDGLISTTPRIVLSVRTADCVPLLFFDDMQKIIGVVHAGWKGSLQRISENMVAQLVDQGAKKENIKVAIGPAIGACCYEIFGERLSFFKAEFSHWPDIFIKNNDSDTLNLLRLNYNQLIHVGINKENIDYFPFCTKCDSYRFYSYNKDKTDKRMHSYIMFYE